jgi:membrane protease YdiL (CAAX protease family)
MTSDDPAASVVCRRCNKTVAAHLLKCPYCEARLPATFAAGALGSADAAALSVDTATTTAVTRLLVFYVLLLSTNLLAHWIAKGLVDERHPDKDISQTVVVLTATMELIDTAIVLIALAAIPRPPPLAVSPRARTLGWITGPFILAIVLALNFAYHALLENYVQFPHWAHDRDPMPIGWAIVLVCIQPGIVEELFFRFIALGTLTRVMGVGAAIIVSSIMFGMAHSAVLLSIPILTVVGIGLGVVRVWSGSILLPMLLHALHNAVVLYLETVK